MANSQNRLVNRLFETLKQKKISVPQFSEETGIPKDRVYKWKQQATDPKAEDEKKVVAWLDSLQVDKNPISRGNGGQASGITGAVSAAQYIDSILEQKRILEVQNDFLRRNFESSLISIREGQEQSGIQLKTLLWYSALVASGGDPKKADKAMVEINNKMGEYAGVKSKASIQHDSGK